MIINRSYIIDRLLDFSQQGNGVIIGKPGIGKSYSIAELADKLADRKIPAFILPIDNLPDGTDQSIEAEIESEGDWLTYLDKIKLQGDERAVLIFDGFDAARDEILRKQILTLISKAISRLKKWNIIVSVRTYDATKSPQLLKLFGNQNYSSEISCRHFEIPELTDNELKSAFDNNPALSQMYEVADYKFKGILRIPFFLKLLGIVVENVDSNELEKLRLIKSETELLDKFWYKQVTNTENSYKKESLLNKIAKNLVENRVLSCLKDDFVQDHVIFKELRSDDLISEVGVGNRYLAFSHNILFDYIVGRLVIPEKPETLLDFIIEDKSRPFFLRPSFIFHFTNLWYQHRDSFWDNYNYLYKQTDIHVLLFKRLIPTSVIANEFENVSDLIPILEKRDVIQQLLQSIRFLSGRNLSYRDIELIYNLSDKLDHIYLWEYAFVFEQILQNENLKQSRYKEKYGVISRNFLRFILNERKVRQELRQSLDRLGSTRGIEFVSKTFNSNSNESRQLLAEVLGFLKEPNFEIWYFSSLADNLKYFIEDGPDFISEVYLKIFSHIEKSDEKTHMGGTVTMNFISNRRQDFEMCYYRLSKLFPTFLSTTPEIAIETGLKIVNNYVIIDKLYFSNDKTPTEIQINDISARFISDRSSMWHENLSYDKPAQLIENIIDFFKQLINEGNAYRLNNYVDTYIANSVVAFTWKKLIEFGNQFPELMKDYLYQLGLNQIVLESSDTTYEIGISIQRIYSLLNMRHQIQLEGTILKILKSVDEEQNKYSKHTVLRLLNCIPKGLIKNKKALSIMAGSESIMNEPTYKSSWSSEPYTTDKWLEEQGVDLKSEANKEVNEQLGILQKFNHQRMNDTPLRQEFIELLPCAINLFNLISNRGKYEEELELTVLKEVCQFYSIITRNSTQIEINDYENAKKAVEFGLVYISKYDKSFDETSSPSSGYSSTPRIEASNALIGLFSFKMEQTIFEAIKRAVIDSNPIVRFNVLKNIALVWPHKPKEYWEIIYERLSNEPFSFTIASVLNNVYRKDIIDDENVNKAIQIAAQRIREFGKRDSFTESYTGLLLYLIDNKKSQVAREIVYDNILSTDFIQTLVFRLFDFIDPKFRDNDYTVESTRKELIQLFKDITSRNLEMLKLVDPVMFYKKENPESNRLFLIDFIIQRIYFGLNINDSIRRKNEIQPTETNQKAFYNRIKPILVNIVESSKEIAGGVIIAHSAHYLIETLNGVIKFYPEEAQAILEMTSQITELAYKTGYTYDSSAIKEVVNLTETLFTDHKELLRDAELLNKLISILNIYVESKWPQALELLWKLDEAFK